MKKSCNDRGGYDKRLHLVAGTVIAAIVSSITANIPPNIWWVAALAGIAAAVLAGIWRELRGRKKQGNHFCPWDLLWTAAGGVLGSPVGALAAVFISMTV